MSAAVIDSGGEDITLAKPTQLFRADVAFTGISRVLNVSPDGQKILLNVTPADRAAPAIVVVHDWATRLAP